MVDSYVFVNILYGVYSAQILAPKRVLTLYKWGLKCIYFCSECDTDGAGWYRIHLALWILLVNDGKKWECKWISRHQNLLGKTGYVWVRGNTQTTSVGCGCGRNKFKNKTSICRGGKGKCIHSVCNVCCILTCDSIWKLVYISLPHHASWCAL